MRLRARQTRFLLLVFAGWTGARLLAWWPGGAASGPPDAPATRERVHGDGRGSRRSEEARPPLPARVAATRAIAPIVQPGTPPPPPVPFASSAVVHARAPSPSEAPARSNRAEAGCAGMTCFRAAAPVPSPARPVLPALAARRASRWAGSAYLFVRPGSGRPSLAAAGELGGSQAAARITWRLDRGGGPVEVALAARLYAPLDGKGAEAAAGLDWHPFPAVPFRLSVERRVGLDHAGRNAWSAYAAGGFYREPLAGTLVLDGYAQAGVVGSQRRDLFVDGALRAGRKLRLGGGVLTAGAGLWGAAQPGVSRLDAGPRLGVVLPLAGHAISAALEGRLRLAGRANPGSGAALTLAAEF